MSRFSCLIIDYGHGGEVDGRYVTAGKQYTHTDASPPLALFEGIEQRKIAVLIIQQLRAAGARVFDCVAGREWGTPPACWHELEQLAQPAHPVRQPAPLWPALLLPLQRRRHEQLRTQPGAQRHRHLHQPRTDPIR